MWNIMKALNYQNRKDAHFIYTGLLAVLLSYGIAWIDSGFDFQNGGMCFISTGSNCGILILLLSLAWTTRICGWDCNDKTINYEILSGHKRRDVYLARVIVSLIWVLAALFLFLVLPTVLVSLIRGWGNQVSLEDALIRYGLIFVITVRIILISAFLSFLIRNCYGALAVGWLWFSMSMFLSLLANIFTDNTKMTANLFSSVKLFQLTDFGNYTTKFIDGKDVIIYKIAAESGEILSTILITVLILAVFGTVVCIFLRKRDMD